MLIHVSDMLKPLDFKREIPIYITKSDKMKVNILYRFSANEEYPFLENAFAIISECFRFKNMFLISSEGKKYIKNILLNLKVN